MLEPNNTHNNIFIARHGSTFRNTRNKKNWNFEQCTSNKVYFLCGGFVRQNVTNSSHFAGTKLSKGNIEHFLHSSTERVVEATSLRGISAHSCHGKEVLLVSKVPKPIVFPFFI